MDKLIERIENDTLMLCIAALAIRQLTVRSK